MQSDNEHLSAARTPKVTVQAHRPSPVQQAEIPELAQLKMTRRVELRGWVRQSRQVFQID